MPDLNRSNLLELLARLSAERVALAVLAADMQGDPKKQGKEKKPGFKSGKSRFPG